MSAGLRNGLDEKLADLLRQRFQLFHRQMLDVLRIAYIVDMHVSTLLFLLMPAILQLLQEGKQLLCICMQPFDLLHRFFIITIGKRL